VLSTTGASARPWARSRPKAALRIIRGSCRAIRTWRQQESAKRQHLEHCR
jgi:hypothetical protein